MRFLDRYGQGLPAGQEQDGGNHSNWRIIEGRELQRPLGVGLGGGAACQAEVFAFYYRDLGALQPPVVDDVHVDGQIFFDDRTSLAPCSPAAWFVITVAQGLSRGLCSPIPRAAWNVRE